MEKETGVQHHNKHIALFFTYGVSLSLWEARGMLARELALYTRLAANGYRFTFFTYGAEDARFSDMLREHHITIVPKTDALPSWFYSFVAPFIHYRKLLACDLLKTNQMLGSWTAVFARWLTRKPLLIRTGYSLSAFAARRGRLRYAAARCIEWFGCLFAQCIIVGTKEDKGNIPCRRSRVAINPNYIDMKQFSSCTRPTRSHDLQLVYVGRLEPQKNVHALIDAIGGLTDVKLTIIGDGSLRKDLDIQAHKCEAGVTFMGPQPHEMLPKLFSKADVFVLPSLYEGLPKVLLEAMAAGMPIVTTDTPGIRTVVTHKKTAYITAPTAEGLRAGIQAVQQDEQLALAMGAAARDQARKMYSLETVAKKEIDIYEQLCSV